MTGKPAQESETAAAPDELAELTRRIAQVEQERDFLRVHTQNLEAELRQAKRDPGRIRELEQLLAEADARLRTVSVVHTARWLVLQPHAALLRLRRRFRETVGWRVAHRLRVLRLKLRLGA
jgi:chromosome segregation ATPase